MKPATASSSGFLGKAGFMVRVMGQFGVGELMLHSIHGWTLLRSGERLARARVARQAPCRPSPKAGSR